MRYLLIPGHNPGPLTGTGNNTYLLFGRTVTLIDAATGEAGHLADLEQALQRESPDSPLDLQRVLVTHAHEDHASGVGALARRWPELECMKRPWPGEDPTDVSWVPLRDDAFVEAGDASLWVVHTPGHSPDHLCFFEPRTSVLFAGDLVLNGGTVVIPASRGGHLASYLRSLHRVLELQPRVILPGHGPAIQHPSALIRGYIAHRQQREQQIVRALHEAQRPLTLDAIVDRVYEKLAPELRQVARESALAHLVMLEENGGARRTPDGWDLST